MIYSERSALVVGAGAVGAVLGARLLAAGWHVTFRIRPETFLAYRRLGVLVRSAKGAFNIEGERFICDAVAPGSHALVLLCTKMPDFDHALRAAQADDDGQRIYVTVQNGLAAPEMAAALFGHRRVLAGAAVVNAYRVGLGEVQMLSEASRLALAPLRVGDAPLAQQVAARLRAAGIDAPTRPVATQLLWSKFVGVEPLATTSAVTQMSVGEIRRTPHALVMLRGLFEEVFAVGRAAGVPLTDELYVKRWRAFFEAPENLRPSLAEDLQQRRPHELNWLTGAVVSLADRTRTAAPLHRRALQMLTRTASDTAGADTT
ncbi:MAG: 2-dehydropantoate 2-reductase [Sutterellaceae bacterium]|nr:2-dehydropantoate 2-reductase [Burkholderiaceae bacterium]MCX7900861.1 2-dehydropantoate 2-reductase [Burkholderiaceae bacterium]MDW8429291.1 2-dehydropantoate 2-reductase [Sutterellaceae bacterium]